MNMKNLVGLFMGGFVVIGLSGCLKSTPIEPAKPVSYVSVVNMSVKAPAVELLFNNEKVTPPINPGAYFPRYSTVDPGARNVVFKKAASDSIVAELSPGQFYDSSTFYTILMYDKVNGGSAAIRITDEFPTTDNTKAYVRFFPLSVDVSSVDLEIENTKLFTNRTPADNALSPTYNQFQSFNPGSFSIRAKVAGTDSVVASTTYSDLLAGGMYSIFFRGVKGGTGNAAFGIEVLRAAN
jgi:hypothetical protein